ncbi:MAG TPA: adenylosuccinate lyase [Verrucomicrobiae bacterium]|nr:adenylosuccinate lyase [Verrucomicrobiae bacterium]
MIRRYSREVMRQIWAEENKFSIWLQIEILACEARKIPAKDLATIKRRATFDVARISEIERTTNHDVIAFLTNVAENVGPASRHIHEGLTSSDVGDTALAVQMVQSVDILIDDVKKLREVIAAKAKKYKLTPMIGRTHGVHAEPITFGLKMALMYDEFGRALERLILARDIIAVGKISGAVGTYAHMNPRVEAYVCKKLGLQADRISTQIVQRDRHAEFMSAIALVGCSIDRWALEFRHLQRTEVLEAEEFFAEGQKGSSAMPHKRNPITCERLCGLARVLRGNAVAAMENVALWHERDISHSSVERIILPDSTELLDYMLVTLTNVVDKLLVYPQRMNANLESSKGLIYSQAVLLALTRKGFTREKAYALVQRNAMKTWAGAKTFKEFLLADTEVLKALTRREIEALFDLKVHFREVDNTFRKVGIR